MKVNIRGRGKIILALFVALLALVAFTTSAFAIAWDGNASGTGQVGVATDKLTRYYNHHPMLWRVSLYVSSNEDGKIKESDTVEHELKWVGEVIYYDWEHMYGDKAAYDNAYVQQGSSVPFRVRDDSESLFNTWSVLDFDEDGYHCHAPGMRTLSADGGKKITTYTNGSSAGRIVAVKGRAFDLFQYSDYGNFEHTDGLLKGSQAGEKTTEIIRDITDYDLGSTNFWTHVLSAIGGQVKDDLNDAVNKGMAKQEAIETYLLPAKDGKMNPDCLVDYALVIESMVMYNTVRDFGLPTNDPSEGANFAWDAYYFALLNNNFGGVLKSDLGSHYGTTAARCHDTYKPEGQSHHGVICSHISSWAGAPPATYAISGGIFPAP